MLHFSGYCGCAAWGQCLCVELLLGVGAGASSGAPLDVPAHQAGLGLECCPAGSTGCRAGAHACVWCSCALPPTASTPRLSCRRCCCWVGTPDKGSADRAAVAAVAGVSTYSRIKARRTCPDQPALTPRVPTAPTPSLCRPAGYTSMNVLQSNKLIIFFYLQADQHHHRGPHSRRDAGGQPAGA